MKGNLKEQRKRTEITFEVERDEESGCLTATWDALRGQGGITTQGKDLRELERNVRDAARSHFANGKGSNNEPNDAWKEAGARGGI